MWTDTLTCFSLLGCVFQGHSFFETCLFEMVVKINIFMICQIQIVVTACFCKSDRFEVSLKELCGETGLDTEKILKKKKDFVDSVKFFIDRDNVYIY